ncbi:MAG: malonyl-ACP O-methyltransferase BioC [Neptuniibacter sp.]
MVEQLIDKQRIAISFSNAAGTYDGLAEFQRQVGTDLLGYLPEQQSGPIMDLGCGTGYFTPLLRHQYPSSDLLNLDLALGMLQFAKLNRPAVNTHWLCADAEALPLGDKSIGLIYSSLAIQWCENLTQLFTEVERILKPGGQFVFSTLGPSTLSELRYAWSEADTYVHVNQFAEQKQIRKSIPDSLSVSEFREELKVLKYSELKELTDELKGIGAHNMNSGQPTGLVGRDKIRKFKAAYEQKRAGDGMLPATYQVFYVVIEKPLEN